MFEPTKEMLNLFTNDIYSTEISSSSTSMEREMEELEISLPSVHDT
jgi:hypothetical protein